MEVLSNKEIYVLLKILNDKKVKKGSSSTIDVDKNFSLQELEHIQNEIALSENKVPEEVLTIENTYKNMFGQSFHSGYKLHIINFQAFTNYALGYVQELTQNNLSGLTEENCLSKLVNEFYANIKDSADIDFYITHEMKYMPVILSAYASNLVEFKTITNTKYDIRRDLNKDILFDNIRLNDTDTVKITIEMNITDFCQRITDCMSSNKQEISIDISSIFSNATIINKEKLKKTSKKAPNVIKSTYHMQPKQWKLFLCLLDAAIKLKANRIQTGEISKEKLIRNGVLSDSTGAQDTAKTRFNDVYNQIRGNKQGEYEDLIYPKVSDTRYYEFDVSRVISFYDNIKHNNYLEEELKKHKYFISQIVD